MDLHIGGVLKRNPAVSILWLIIPLAGAVAIVGHVRARKTRYGDTT